MRVVALVDMDCFYCQVEEKLNPELQGKPVAVVQYNLWREGGIIAANYLAKEKGVTKGMWKHEARDLCPEIEFARVAELRGRADLTKYREAGKKVVDVLSTFPILLQRASIDEAYLDLTEAVKQELTKGITNIPLQKLKTTHIVGYEISDFISNLSSGQDTDGFCEDDLKLAIGAIIVERMRSCIYEQTGYRCSAGIARNKILAKLVCGLHKPNKQTILPGNAVPQFLSELPLKKIKGLGGKFGRKVSEELNVNNVGELLQFPEGELSRKFDAKTGHWLYNIARGMDNEPVLPKLLSKSISCCKRFPGKNALFKHKDVEYWMKELALEVAKRLTEDREQNNRIAKMATVSFVQYVDKKDVNISKTFPLRSYDTRIISQSALEILRKFCHKPDGLYYLKYLGISVGTFENVNNVKDIKYFFQKRNSITKRDPFSHRNDEKNEISDTIFPPSEVSATRSDSNKSSSSICENSSLILKTYTSSSNAVHNVTHTVDRNEEMLSSEELAKFNKNSSKERNCFDLEIEEEISEGDEESSEVIDENSFFVRYFSRLASEIIDDSSDEISSSEFSTENDSGTNSDPSSKKRKLCEFGNESTNIISTLHELSSVEGTERSE